MSTAAVIYAWDVHNDAHDADATVAAGNALRAALLASEAKLAAIERALADVAPPPGTEMRHDGTEDPEAAAYVEGVRTATAAVREVLGEQPAGVLLTPEEAQLAVWALRGVLRRGAHAEQREALVARLGGGS